MWKAEYLIREPLESILLREHIQSSKRWCHYQRQEKQRNQNIFQRNTSESTLVCKNVHHGAYLQQGIVLAITGNGSPRKPTYARPPES
jgi:hypothetical protein